MIQKLESSKKPVVAAINGSCLGGGLEVRTIIIQSKKSTLYCHSSLKVYMWGHGCYDHCVASLFCLAKLSLFCSENCQNKLLTN